MVVKKSDADNSLDTILIHLGDFGKYQIYVFSLVCLAVVLHSAVHVAFVFTAMDLNYRCEIPGCDIKDSPYNADWIQNVVPNTRKFLSKCDMYAPYSNYTGIFGNCSEVDFDLNIIERCSSFIYESDEKTIVQEYNLHCDNNLWKLTMVGTTNNVGQFFGLLISGFISDRYGRKTVLVWGMVLTAICGLIRTLMPTYQMFLVFEFLDAAFGAGTYICGFVLGVELVGPKNRVLTGTLASSCYAIGEIFVAGSAWLVKSWKHLIYIVYSPSLLLITYIWILPESIRWNLSKGRIDEAKITLRTLAKVNGKEITEAELEKLDIIESNEPQEIKHPFKEAIKSSKLMLRLITCCFCWITCTFLFYGLTLNSVSLAGNSYLDFVLTAIVEIPAYFCCSLVIDRFGRKNTLSCSYVLTGTACLCFIFIPSNSHWGSLAVYLIGKFGATVSFTVLYVLTSEMFPTTMRHSFMGTCSTFGRCGSMISPQTPLLAQIWTPLPLVSFAVMSGVAGILTLTFPETLNKKLPDTIEEAENIGNKEVVIVKEVITFHKQ